MEQWAWGNVAETLTGGWQAFVRLCNVRFKRLENSLREIRGRPRYFYPEDFGLSLATAHVAIQAAADAARDAGGGIVFCRENTYTLRDDVALPSKVTLMGVGDGTVFQSESDTTDGHSLVTMTGVEHAHVRHLKLDGKASARTLLSAASGASIAGSRYCSIEDVTVVDCGRTAANFEGVALGMTGLEADAGDTSGNRIVHCRVEDPDGRLSFGIRLYTDWTVNQADSAYVNEVRDNLVGWNVIVGVGFNGIEIAGPATRYNLIEGNQVRDHVGVSGIEADKGAQYNRYVGNSVVNMEATASAGEAAAFRDQGFPAGAHPERFATGNVWVGNTADTIFRDDGTEDSLYGLLLSRSKQCTVLGHRIRDVSSVGFASTTGGSRAFGCNNTVERLRVEGCRSDGVNVGLALSAATTVTGLTLANNTLRVGLYGTLNASANVFTQVVYGGNVIEAISAGTTGIDLGAESSVLIEGNTLVGFTLGIATGTATVRLGLNTFLSCTTQMSGSGIIVARTLPGALGLAAASRADAALDVELGGLTTGTTQYGVLVDTIPDNTSTTRHIAAYARARSAASVYTVGTATSLYAANPSAGAGSTITTAIGLEVENVTAGGTNNYALRVGTGNVGFHGVTPVARPSALTQSYATASRTHAAYTADAESGAYTGVDNLQVGSVYATVADLNALRVAVENLRVHHESTAQFVNTLADDLQAVGLEQ